MIKICEEIFYDRSKEERREKREKKRKKEIQYNIEFTVIQVKS